MQPFRSLFSYMIALSVLAHAGVALWSSTERPKPPPKALPTQSGKWSIALRASAESKATDVAITKTEPPPQPVKNDHESLMEELKKMFSAPPTEQLEVLPSMAALNRSEPIDVTENVQQPEPEDPITPQESIAKRKAIEPTPYEQSVALTKQVTQVSPAEEDIKLEATSPQAPAEQLEVTAADVNRVDPATVAENLPPRAPEDRITPIPQESVAARKEVEPIAKEEATQLTKQVTQIDPTEDDIEIDVTLPTTPMEQLEVLASASEVSRIEPTVTENVQRPMPPEENLTPTPQAPIAERKQVEPTPEKPELPAEVEKKVSELSPSEVVVDKSDVKREESKAAQGSKASQGSEVDNLPSPRYNPSPDYPTDALDAGIEGQVTLRIRISNDGVVQSVRVRTSSGTKSLDESAASTVRRWRFYPLSPDVPHEVDKVFNFVIRR